MAKPTAVWGLDLGQCALKALKLELVDGKPTATAYDYIEHPKILSQPDADPDALCREALEKFLSRNPMTNELVAVSIASQSGGLARFVKLPPVEESKIADIVKFEAKQQIPFPLEEVVWDFQKIAGGEKIENMVLETEVGLFAMKRDLIARHLAQFNTSGVECHVVQMAPLALTNFATYELMGRGGPDAAAGGDDADTPRGKKKCVVVLDVGADNSNLIITDAGKIIWQRPLPIGGNHFTRALTKEMKLTFAKAEHLKRNAAKSPDLASILKALRPVLSDFVGEVQRSLGYFTNTHRDAHVSSMVGLGSAFKLPGLQKYMQEKLSLDVKRPTRFDRLAGDKVTGDAVFAENVLTFPVAYGLALQGLNGLSERKDYGRLNTNLLPKEIRTERLIRAKKPYAAAAAALLTLGTGLTAIGFGVKYAAATDKQIAKAAEEALSVGGQADAQATKKRTGDEEVAKSTAEVKAIVEGSDRRLDWVRLHQYITTCLPRHGETGNLNGDDTRVSLWNNDKGGPALKAYMERVKKGLSIERINDPDLSEFLAQVNVHEIRTRYTDNLTDTFTKIEDFAWTKSNKPIGEDMLPSEAERDTDVANPKGWKLKPPTGNGWVVEVRGSTFHNLGAKFLQFGLVKNFQMGAVGFDRTGVERLKNLLPGTTDPLQNRISHVALMYSRAPQKGEKVTTFIDPSRSFIDACIVTSASGAAAAPAAGMDTMGGMMPPGMMGGGAATGGWKPLSGGGGGSDLGGFNPSGGEGGEGRSVPGGMGGMGSVPGAGASLSGAGPSGAGPMGGGEEGSTPSMGGMGGMSGGYGGDLSSQYFGGDDTPGQQKQRCVFVLVFVWRDAAGPAGEAATPPATP